MYALIVIAVLKWDFFEVEGRKLLGGGEGTEHGKKASR